jgi:hypothetical protein
MSTASIQPFDYITTSRVVSFNVTCQSLTLFQTADFRIESFDVNKSLVVINSMSLTQEQYLEWNNNDEYIMNLAATQLGYTIVPGSMTRSSAFIV